MTPHPELPSFLTPWIMHETSITDKLFEHTGDARLKVLKQCFRRTNRWEAEVLHLEKGAVFHREILMYSGKTPCWYARTLIPKEAYRANEFFFARLEQESLGALIYDEPTVKRKERMHCSLDPQSMVYHWLGSWLHESEPVLWMRLSVFEVREMHLFYLVEIFLPGLMRVCH